MGSFYHTLVVATLMPLSSCCIIVAYNRYASGVRAALPELIVIYEPLPITTQARHYATRGSITTATLPFGCGLSAYCFIGLSSVGDSW